MPNLSSHRIRYFLGDLAATVLAGALVAGVAAQAVPAGPSRIAGMFAGMLVGMALSVPLTLAVSSVLGMIEPMLQIMFGCMLAGMSGAMAAPAAGLGDTVAQGAGCGLATCVAFAVADRALRKWGAE